jgi:hypothetical protein
VCQRDTSKKIKWKTKKKKQKASNRKPNKKEKKRMKKRRALNTRERGLPYNDSRVHHSVCQGLLVPIHRDTQIDLKTEKGDVVKGHNKKRSK